MKPIQVLNLFFLLAFALSALVQFNDPDAAPWIAVYLAACAMCVARHRGACPRWLPLLLLVVSLLWIGTLVPSLGDVSVDEIFESVSMKTRAVEEAREIGGLALVAIWSAVLVHRGGR